MLLYILFCTLLISGIPGCKKEDAVIKQDSIVSVNASDATASQYSSDVIDKWITMQLRLMRDATGIPNVAFSRYYAYSGIAALQALTPGLSETDALTARWNGLSGLPVIQNFQHYYYWPASVIAALAAMNRNIFTTANAADKAAIDSLENALNTSYLLIKNAAVITRSDAFGKSVADAVFNWSENDGYTHASDPYTPKAGLGLWIPTAPAFAPPVHLIGARTGLLWQAAFITHSQGLQPRIQKTRHLHFIKWQRHCTMRHKRLQQIKRIWLYSGKIFRVLLLRGIG
jgi:hypothetical protein